MRSKTRKAAAKLLYGLLTGALLALVASAPARAEGESCATDFAKIAKSRAQVKMDSYQEQADTLLSRFFPEKEDYVLQDGTHLIVPKVSDENREALQEAVEGLLEKKAALGLIPKKTVEEFKAWAANQSTFPTPSQLKSGATLENYAQQLVVESILATHKDPTSLLASLKGNLPELTLRAAKASLRGAKWAGAGLFGWLSMSIGVGTIGNVAQSFLSSPLDPLNDWANKRSAEYLGWLQHDIQNTLTGDNTGDDDDSAKKTEAVATAKKGEVAIRSDLSSLEKETKTGKLTTEEKAKLWKQLGARFYELNFKLSKTFQDNVNNGRGSFETRVLQLPLQYAAQIQVAEVNFDMHKRNVEELQAKIAALPAGVANDQARKAMQKELGEHQQGKDSAEKTIAANLAAWEMERFIYPETSDKSPEDAGKEGFSDAFDQVSASIGFDALVGRYDEAIRDELLLYDKKLDLLQRLANRKTTAKPDPALPAADD